MHQTEMAPEKYYPKGYHPVLLDEWPVDGELQAAVEFLPEDFKASVSENHNRKERLKKARDDKDD